MNQANQSNKNGAGGQGPRAPRSGPPREDHRPAMAAILGEISQGKSPVLDDLKQAWGSAPANQAIRELSKQGLAGVHRRRVHKADGERYRFSTGMVAQRGPGRFLMVLEDGSEAYLTAKSSRAVADGDKIRAFLASEVDADTEALPAGVESRDLSREHVARAKALPSGEVAFFLDNRVEEVRLSLSIPDAKAGDLWLCKFQERGLFRDQVSAAPTQRIGNEADKGIESKLAFMTRFSDDTRCVDAQWPKVYSVTDSVDNAPRRAIHDMPLATIDGESTSDFDDAISAVATDQGWRVTVAIADVSAFVEPGGALDQFALKKMTSVYLPHQVQPMLPRSISNGICSLNPGEKRLALCCEIQVDRQGAVTSHDFFRAEMTSHARLTYSGAQAFLDGSVSSLGSPAVDASVKALSEAAKAMREHGAKAGRLDMGDDEISFEFNEHGKICDLKSSARLWTHKLVEECMLAANCAAAERVEKAFDEGIFRNHVGIKPESLDDMKEALGLIGLSIGKEGDPITQAQIAATLEDGKALGKYGQARSAILGAMSSASYESKNKGHFSLVAKQYCHFTSPIRRYPDLMVHRMIKASLDARPSPYAGGAATELARKASECGQLASQAENEARKLLINDYMKTFIGQSFDSRVATVGERGVWTALPLGAAALEFFVGAKALKEAGFSWSTPELSWLGADKTPLREGDTLACLVAGVDPAARRVELAPQAAPRPEHKPASAKP
jgi:ribonuclease R